VKLMSDQLQTYSQATLKDLPSAISLQGLVDGAQQLDLLVGEMIDQCGQEARHASLSVQQVTEKDKTMSDTCGQYSSISSASADLQSSLESRLRQRLELAGSMIYKLTWKQKVTPRQWSYCQRAASVPRTKETDSGQLQSGWATPNTMDHMALRSDEALLRQATTVRNGRTFPANLREQVDPRSQEIYATKQIPEAWPTPMHTDGSKACNRYRENHQNGLGAIASTVEASSWATPTVRDYKNTGNLENYIFGSQTGRIRTDSVSTQAYLVDSGQTTDSFTAETGKPVKSQLNPRFSLWLMGYPIEWAFSGERVTPLSRKSQRK
jgi:hypothetical protein